MPASQIGLCMRRQPGPVHTQAARCCGGLKKATLHPPHAPTPVFKAAGKRGGGSLPNLAVGRPSWLSSAQPQPLQDFGPHFPRLPDVVILERSAPSLKHKGYFLSDPRASLVLGDRPPAHIRLDRGCVAQLSCFPVETGWGVGGGSEANSSDSRSS